MKTQVSVETSDRVRFLLGMQITGEPVKATREQVRAYFTVICDAEIDQLEARTDDMVSAVVARLGSVQTQVPETLVEEEAAK